MKPETSNDEVPPRVNQLLGDIGKLLAAYTAAHPWAHALNNEAAVAEATFAPSEEISFVLGTMLGDACAMAACVHAGTPADREPWAMTIFLNVAPVINEASAHYLAQHPATVVQH